MALGAPYEQTAVTVGATEYSLTNNSTTIASQTTDGIYSVWIDCANMAAGDEYEIAKYEKVTAAGTQRRIVLGNITGAQADPYEAVLGQLMHAWDVTLKKISGTDRAFTWSVRAVT